MRKNSTFVNSFLSKRVPHAQHFDPFSGLSSFFSSSYNIVHRKNLNFITQISKMFTFPRLSARKTA